MVYSSCSERGEEGLPVCNSKIEMTVRMKTLYTASQRCSSSPFAAYYNTVLVLENSTMEEVQCETRSYFARTCSC
jgi:hypothetical protein